MATSASAQGGSLSSGRSYRVPRRSPASRRPHDRDGCAHVPRRLPGTRTRWSRTWTSWTLPEVSILIGPALNPYASCPMCLMEPNLNRAGTHGTIRPESGMRYQVSSGPIRSTSRTVSCTPYPYSYPCGLGFRPIHLDRAARARTVSLIGSAGRRVTAGRRGISSTATGLRRRASSVLPVATHHW